MDEIKNAEYQQAFLKLKQAYVRRLENTVRIIDNILDLEQFSLPSRADMVRAQALVHGLAGSGTTFGYPQVTVAGRDADHVLTDILKHIDQGHEVDAQDKVDFTKVLEIVQQVCNATSREARIEMPDLANTNIYMTLGVKGHAHILIVDDDKEVASLIAQALESREMTVQLTASGEDALHYLARVMPDLVIVDKELKGMGGMEVLQQIKQSSEFIDIPVLVLATRSSDEDQAWALRAGAADYIRKPVDAQKLCDRVVQVVNAREDQSQSI